MTDPFRFEYQPATILYGRGTAADLGEELGERGRPRALVVCGRTVGSTEGVIRPVTDGLGDRLAGVFDRTTPEKTLATAVEGAERVAESDADALVGLGGGSSLDVAKLIAVLAGHDRPAADVAREMVADGRVHLPDGDLLPVVTVPTTLAGADLSMVAGTRLALDADAADDTESAGVSDRRLMPTLAVYDPALFATTPRSVLVESAMNGFDKGVEMIYARENTAVTDATASRGLELLRRGLPTLGPGEDPALGTVVCGMVLVQYGLSTESTYRASLIHAFGHGFARRYDVTQGVVHAILAPHVLRYLFERVDARRELLARALDVDPDGGSPDAVADAVVAEVVAVRDAMGLPTRLRSVDGLAQSHLPAVAEAVVADSFIENVPPDLDPTAAAVERVLREAW